MKYPWVLSKCIRSSWTASRAISVRCYSWKNFTLEDDLTLEVKQSIEKKWWKHVYGTECPAELSKSNKPIQEKGKYILSMFPYPSGKLHLGHVRVYTLSDVLARFYRLQGYSVIHPMGWDAFGLPAENAARDNKIQPDKWTKDNIEFMKKQIISIGCCFDWHRELATCDPSYYKWTQWLFTKLWEKGLVYKKRAYVFWDPVDQTVLAEEQVDSEMRSWRSGAKVEKKMLSQWFVKTTSFAEQLMSELESGNLKDGWRDIIDLQTHWIGSMKGYHYDYQVNVEGLTTGELAEGSRTEPIRIWFANEDALKKSKYFILRPEHFLAKNESCVSKVFEDGVKLLKFFLLNPANGQMLPVVTGPATTMPMVPESCDCRTDVRLDDELGDLGTNEEMLENISAILGDTLTSKPYQGDINISFSPSSLKLRDWLVSRQRKWGTPIPVSNCTDCGQSSILPEELLPISRSSKLQHTCQHCGSDKLELETDTLDTFFDSSWYYLRYLDSINKDRIFDTSKVQNWLPVDIYIGGKEHATLHLYYARFMNHFIHTLGLVPVTEPFQKLIPVGSVMGETFYTKNAQKCIPSNDIEQQENQLVQKSTGEIVVKQWEKMSKSKFNGIDPEVVLNDYGIDTTRLLSVSEAAPTSARHWPPNNLTGFLNWQQKAWQLTRTFVDTKDFGDILFEDEEEWAKSESKIFDSRNYYLKGITHNYAETSQISVVISRMQGMLGDLRAVPTKYLKESIEFERAFGAFLICMYPILPAFSAQLWQSFRAVATHTEVEFNLDKEVWEQSWPEVDQSYKLDLMCMFNGEEVSVKVERQYLDGMDEETAVDLAFEEPIISGRINRDTTRVVAYQVEPGFRAVLRLHDPTSKLVTKKDKKKQKSKKISKESSGSANVEKTA